MSDDLNYPYQEAKQKKRGRGPMLIGLMATALVLAILLFNLLPGFGLGFGTGQTGGLTTNESKGDSPVKNAEQKTETTRQRIPMSASAPYRGQSIWVRVDDKGYYLRETNQDKERFRPIRLDEIIQIAKGTTGKQTRVWIDPSWSAPENRIVELKLKLFDLVAEGGAGLKDHEVTTLQDPAP